MKVCLLAPEFLPNWGGVGTYSVELARELSRLVDLTVLTLARTRGSREYTREEMEAALEFRASVHVLSEAKDTFLYNAGFQIAVLRALRRLLRTERFEIIHSQHAHMPDLLFRNVNRAPIIVTTVHTTIRQQRMAIRVAEQLGGILETSEKWQVALSPILRVAEWMTFRYDGHYITVSEWMRQQLVLAGLPVNRVNVVYNGVNTELFRPRVTHDLPLFAETESPTVLFSGRPTLVKGAGILARTIPLVLEEVPDANFAFVGGESREFLDLLAQNDVPEDRLNLLGYVDFEMLPAIYAAAGVAAAPTFYENLPLRVLEVMASGVPVVASDVCGLPEVIASGENGLLVPPGSPEALAEALILLLQDDGERKRMGKAARESIVGRFSWSRAATESLEVYEHIIGRAT